MKPIIIKEYILVIQTVGNDQDNRPDVTRWESADLPDRIAYTFNLFDDFQAWVYTIDKTCDDEDFKNFMEYNDENPIVE